MIFQRFKNELDKHKLPYQIIKGTFPERIKSVTTAIEKLVNLQK
jgi:nicotinamide riboside kinase